MAMENPPFWWFLLGKMVIFMRELLVSGRVAIGQVRYQEVNVWVLDPPSQTFWGDSMEEIWHPTGMYKTFLEPKWGPLFWLEKSLFFFFGGGGLTGSKIEVIWGINCLSAG